MQEGDRAQQLQHQGLHFAQLKFGFHAFHQRFQVVVQVLHHDVDLVDVRTDHDLLHVHDVLVSRLQQQIDLTQRCDRKAVLFVLHLHFLQRHNLAGPLVFRLEHDAIGA